MVSGSVLVCAIHSCEGEFGLVQLCLHRCSSGMEKLGIGLACRRYLLVTTIRRMLCVLRVPYGTTCHGVPIFRECLVRLAAHLLPKLVV